MNINLTNNASKKVKLNNGIYMPQLGLGTYRVHDAHAIDTAVDIALETGYRLFDTAAVYRNESYVGNSIRNLLQKYGLKREDIFVTSKLSPSDHGYENAIKGFERSLNNIGLDYIDLYLIHFPGAARINSENPLNRDLRTKTWEALVDVYKQGKVKSIGVSNFTVKHLEHLRESSVYVPVVNQVEWHPYYHQQELKDYCKANGICLQGYMPLGGFSQGDQSLMNNRVVNSLASRYTISPAQVLLQWCLQQDVTVLIKSVTRRNIIENYNLAVNMSSEDLALLNSLNINCKYAWDPTPVI